MTLWLLQAEAALAQVIEASGRRPSAVRDQPVKPSGCLADSQPDQQPPCGQRMG
jgi:hypothetical protein